MRDLYLPLGLNPAASEAEIRAAISRYSGAIPSGREIADILLNSRRRKVYDRAWTTLHSLGRLRANLGMHDQAWAARNHDFITMSDGCPTFRAQQDAIIAGVLEKDRQEKRKRKIILIACGIGVALILMFLKS